MDYQTGELVAYVGSADPYATKATKKFQPRFDVLADGWRQPGLGVQARRLRHRHRGPPHHGRHDVHGRRDQLRGRLHPDRRRQRGARSRPRRGRPPLLAQHPRGQGHGRHRQRPGPGPGREDGRPVPERPGGRRPVLRPGRRGGPPQGPRARLRRAGERWPAGGPDHDHDRDRAATARSCWARARGRHPSRRWAPTARRVLTDILAGNTNPNDEPVLGQVRDHGRQQAAAGDAQDRHQQRRPGPQRVRLHRGADHGRADGRRVRAGRGCLERQLRQLARQHAARSPVLHRGHHLRLAGLPGGGDEGLGDPRVQPGGRAGRRRPWTRGRACSPARARRRPWTTCSWPAPPPR